MQDPKRHPRPAAVVCRAGSSRGAISSIGDDRCRVLVSATDSAGALAVLEWTGHTPGGPPLHVHPDQDELFMVDAGRYRFRCGDEEHELEAGDSIFLPRAVPHSFCQLGDHGRLRFAYTPAGSMEAFFEALAALPGPPSPDAAAALFERHGMHIQGPPLALA